MQHLFAEHDVTSISFQQHWSGESQAKFGLYKQFAELCINVGPHLFYKFQLISIQKFSHDL